MEASDAGLTQDTTSAEEPAGNGIVVVCGIFEPGAVVELYKVDSDHVMRAEGGELVGRRIANDAREVGFDGLNPGDLFFATGYTSGEYREVRCRAQDPSSGVTLFQQPVQPSPTTIGTQQTTVADAPPAAPADVGDGVGLPAGVSSPILADESSTATPGSPPARDDAGVSPGDVDVVAGTEAAQPEATQVYVYEGSGDPDESWQKAEVQEKVTPEDAEQEPRALYRFVGDKSQLDTFPPEGFTLYEGATEAVADDSGKTADEHPADEAAALQAQKDAEADSAKAADEAAAAKAAEEAATQASDDEAAAKAATEHDEAVAAEQKADSEAAAAKAQAEQSAQAAEAAPVSDPNPPAPDAGTPDASDSSGTGQANGGAVEQEGKLAAGGVTFEGGATSTESATDAQGQPAADAAAPVVDEGQTTTTSASQPADGTAATAPADAPAEPPTATASADPAAATDTAAAAPAADSSPTPSASDWDKLASQAIDLGVTNTATMSDAELRQSITEKNATPVV